MWQQAFANVWKGGFLPRKSPVRTRLKLYARYFTKMLDRGFLLPPSQYEGIFVSDAHTDADVDSLVSAAEEVFNELLAEDAQA